MKKRTITIALIVFAVALLFGIGYAGWVISSTTSGEASGNFTAYSVESANLTVTNVDQSVTFGMPASPTSTVWLEGQSVGTEDLVASFKISWPADVSSGISFTLTHEFYMGTDPEAKVVDSAVLANIAKLISGPTYSLAAPVTGVTLSGSTITLGSNYVKGTEVTINVTYQWGPSLGGSEHQNPHTFFNAKDPAAAPQSSELYASEASYSALAASALAALDNFVTTNSLHYKVVVTKTA